VERRRIVERRKRVGRIGHPAHRDMRTCSGAHAGDEKIVEPPGLDGNLLELVAEHRNPDSLQLEALAAMGNNADAAGTALGGVRFRRFRLLVCAGFGRLRLGAGGLGAAAGVVCANAGSTSAIASHKATVRITSGFSISRCENSRRLDQRSRNRKSPQDTSARAPDGTTPERFSRHSRRSLLWSESALPLSSRRQAGHRREFRRRRHRTAAGSIAPRVAAWRSVSPPHGRAVHSLIGRNIRSRFS
jgi:hypothetical protein